MFRRQYISMLLWTFGLKEASVKREALPLPIFARPGSTLGKSGQNHYQNSSIPCKAFCLWSSLWFFLARPWIHPSADLITRGPRAFYRSPHHQQQTVQSEKRQPKWQDSNKCTCRRQYIRMLLLTFGLKEDLVKGEAPPLPVPIFARPWIHSLEYLAETTSRMASF